MVYERYALLRALCGSREQGVIGSRYDRWRAEVRSAAADVDEWKYMDMSFLALVVTQAS